MPASRLQGIGELDWAHGFQPQLHIESSTLALGDVLSWYRALQPDVAEDLRADCALGLDLKLGGWPIQLQQGAIASAGGTLTAKSLPAPLQIGAVKRERIARRNRFCADGDFLCLRALRRGSVTRPKRAASLRILL